MTTQEKEDQIRFDERMRVKREERVHWQNRFRIASIIGSLLVLVLIKQFALYIGWVPSESMEPMIMTNSLIFVNRLSYLRGHPQRGDIVAFQFNDDPTVKLKRIVAIGGDTVELRDDKIYLNGYELVEEYISGIPTEAYSQTSYKVPKGYCLLLGDNRSNSDDSRYWEQPYVPNKDIIGKVFFNVSLKDRYMKPITSCDTTFFMDAIQEQSTLQVQ